jgi:hypothetical protein
MANLQREQRKTFVCRFLRLFDQCFLSSAVAAKPTVSRQFLLTHFINKINFCTRKTELVGPIYIAASGSSKANGRLFRFLLLRVCARSLTFRVL